MLKYEAEFEMVRDDSDFAEALRGPAWPRIHLIVEARTRLEACTMMADAMSAWWPDYDVPWWDRHLKVIRGKRAKE